MMDCSSVGKTGSGELVFQEVTLDDNKQDFDCLGGLPYTLGKSKVPKNTAYGRLARPPMAALSKKYRDLSKCKKVVLPVIEHFFNGKLNVKWRCTKNSLRLEGYIPSESRAWRTKRLQLNQIQAFHSKPYPYRKMARN